MELEVEWPILNTALPNRNPVHFREACYWITWGLTEAEAGYFIAVVHEV